MRKTVALAMLVGLGSLAHAEVPVGGSILIPKSSIACETTYRGGGGCAYCDPDYGYGYGYGYRPRPSRPFSTLTVAGGIEGVTTFTANGTCHDIQVVPAGGNVEFLVQQRNAVKDELGVTTSLLLKTGFAFWTGRKHETTR